MQQLNSQMQARPVQSTMNVAKQKEKHRYIFPNPLAKMMKNVPMNVQLESSMMASGLILIGMILMAIFLVFFTSQTIAFKVLTLINLVGAFIFISSAMVTTYQQYVSYMDVIELQKAMGMQDLMGSDLAINDLNMVRPKNRKNQFLFFGGLLTILVGLTLKYWLWDIAPSLEQYSIWMNIGIITIGVLMIFLVFKKPKTKKIVRRIIKKPIQQQAPVEGPNLAFRAPSQQETQEPRPLPRRSVSVPEIPAQNRVINQERPVQNMISAARPVPQRPVPQRPVPQRPVPQRPVPQRPGIGYDLRRNNDIKPKIKKPNKGERMLGSVEKTLNEKLYEINRLKAQQR